MVIWLLWGWFGAGVLGPNLSFFQVLGLYMISLFFFEEKVTVNKCSSLGEDGFINNTILDTILEITAKPLFVFGIGYIAKMSM
ncbi:hypothetical protein SMUL_1765 [Sulfurospirillum multivorans DSM 12446]|uniref:Uncharacterized protein n=1 Tax=Sulfurospirillum multivorans (strain DM 12446 / JCM 15788 / NBRC 109480) TaxID=1150621 RepID=A0AA86DZY3_SULMK|nr:hypothetical protein SMUL_1765 [Sulfurospirillum multivorans DSM 12446]